MAAPDLLLELVHGQAARAREPEREARHASAQHGRGGSLGASAECARARSTPRGRRARTSGARARVERVTARGARADGARRSRPARVNNEPAPTLARRPPRAGGQQQRTMSAVSSQLLCTAGDASTRTATRARALPHRRRRRRGCRPSRCSRGDPRPRGPPRALPPRLPARSRARGASACRPPRRRPPRRPVLVLAGSRFRDETERQRAIDRLSPKPPGAPADDASDPRLASRASPPRARRAPGASGCLPRILRRPSRRPRRLGRGRRRRRRPGPARARARRRAERAESESADRLEYLVAVIRRELGRPQALLAADADVKARRFDALSSALKNFGFVEVMFGLVKYYYAHWDEPPEGFESAAATRAEDEHESSAAGRRWGIR